MALKAKHVKVTNDGEKSVTFGVGDRVKVQYKVSERGKTRLQAFEGLVIGIRGEGENKSFTVRKIGVQQIGIERIFPIVSPYIDSVEVTRPGVRGTRRAKLYYTRNKSRKEIESIYTRAKRRGESKLEASKTKVKPEKKVVKKSPKNAQKKTSKSK